ncbi:hypothetical protein GT755_29780 [Herbidospora sp. NEAU-GS84]|uniref:Uncharacterized protein n=1 Tax=Herbidospora solisilvae TaxID=2696284 RepID=A0A7C9J7D9_9ACTN|nr:hypothetical protein [Herbidospora solisilvae]NAS25860.1 hypothetical protein [Herbidospora solisilvae]
MHDYRNGAMSGADDNIERLTGKRPMTVAEYARPRAALLTGSSRGVTPGPDQTAGR